MSWSRDQLSVNMKQLLLNNFNSTSWKVKTQTTGAYSRFIGVKHLGVFLLPPGRVASPLQGYPPPPPFMHLGEERREHIKFR